MSHKFASLVIAGLIVSAAPYAVTFAQPVTSSGRRCRDSRKRHSSKALCT